MQPAHHQVLVRHFDGVGDPDRRTAGQLLHGQSAGRPEQPRVAVGAASVGPPLGHRVHDLYAGQVRGAHEPGDPVQHARGLCLLGQFGQRTVRAHHALLAFDSQQHGVRGVDLLPEPVVRTHGGSRGVRWCRRVIARRRPSLHAS